MKTDTGEGDGSRSRNSKTIPPKCQVFRASAVNLPQIASIGPMKAFSPRIAAATAGSDYGSWRPAYGHLEHGVQQGFGVRALRAAAQDIGEPVIEQQHGETVEQRPRPHDRGGLIERQSLFGNLLMPAGADRAGQPCERGIGGLMQRRPLHVETLGAEHQPVHAGMRLRIGDIGLGAGRRLLRQRGAGRGGSRHRGAELPVADRGEFADEAGQVAEMMGRCGVRDTGLARHRAQRQSRQPVALEHPFGRLEQRAVQRAVMVRRGFPCCGGGARCASFPRCPRRRNIIVGSGPGAGSGVAFFLSSSCYRSRFLHCKDFA